MLLDHTRTETRSSHQALEKLLIPRMKSISAREDYAALLALFYGYFLPLEEKIAQHVNPERIPDLDVRRKAETLLQDYIKVTGNDWHIPLCDDLPEVKNEADALAVLYVIEGSTLGGRIITQMLTDRLGIRPEDGITFFNGYGEETPAMWQAFTTILEAYSGDQEKHRSMARTADETFVKFKNWIALN